MKIIVTIIITAVIVLFSMQNFVHVPVHYFGGKPVQIRLIFVIAISGITGYLIRYIIGVKKEEAVKRKLRFILSNNGIPKKNMTEKLNNFTDELEDELN